MDADLPEMGVSFPRRFTFSWSVERQYLDTNPVEGVRGLYQNNRADVIVEDHELTEILAHATKNAGFAIRMAAATGMRRGDLVQLKWSHITDNAIIMVTEKSNQTRRVMVPLLKDARAVIGELRRRRDELISQGKVPSAFVLTTKHGGPWTEDAVTQAFIRAASAAGIDKHLHDLRGTAVTRLALAQVSDEEIADIVGWEPSKVRRVKRYYVDRDRIVLGVIERVEGSEKTG